MHWYWIVAIALCIPALLISSIASARDTNDDFNGAMMAASVVVFCSLIWPISVVTVVPFIITRLRMEKKDEANKRTDKAA